tara:strand:+ start:128 stop:652 length:525 start_codon:yes stop_codon:yes gene_type:complete
MAGKDKLKKELDALEKLDVMDAQDGMSVFPYILVAIVIVFFSYVYLFQTFPSWYIYLLVPIFVVWYFQSKINKRKKELQRRIEMKAKKKPFLPSHVKTQAEKEYHRLVRKFKSKHKRNPSKNELFKIVKATTHNIDFYKGERGHMRRQKVRKHLILKYKIRNKYTMTKPKTKKK